MKEIVFFGSRIESDAAKARRNGTPPMFVIYRKLVGHHVCVPSRKFVKLNLERSSSDNLSSQQIREIE